MYHFFVEKEQIKEKTITILGADVNHIKNVLRMKIGDQITISNRIDKEYVCELSALSDNQVEAVIVDSDQESTELPAKIYLFQGLPKADKMEFIIQKAVELGAYEIIPLATKRSVVKLDAKKEAAKRKRWQIIAESAAKQSKRIIIPEVMPVMSLSKALSYADAFSCKLIPYEKADGMQETKRAMAQALPNTSIGVFIGPEGGFEENEIALAIQNNCIPITLGKRILRTETAGLTTLSILMFQLEKGLECT